ncbi:MAG: hypothetical protein ACM3U2_02465 [Deltaproteobacteria bacterium]
MRPNLLIAEFEAGSRASVSSSPRAVEALDDALIAGFTPVEIAQMTDDELVRAIRAARLPLPSGVDEHLELHDRRTLERLVYLARRCCQTRSSAAVVRQTVLYGGE